MQTAIALGIVFVAAVYAGWKFLPARLRAALASKSAAWIQTKWHVSPENVRRIESKLASGGACGSCDSCKACASPTPITDPQEKRDAAFAVIPIYETK